MKESHASIPGQTACFNLASAMIAVALGCGGAAGPATENTTAARASALPPAAEAPAEVASTERSARPLTLDELKHLTRSDMAREWSLHGVTAIPVGCSRDAVEITYDAEGAPKDTTKPTWTGKCIDETTHIPANILSGVRKDATDRPAQIKPSFFDGKDAVVFEYPGDYSLHLREMGPGLFLGRQAHEGKATSVVYLVGRFQR